MRTAIAGVVVWALAAAPLPGSVTGISSETAPGIGTFKFTIQGTNPCGAVYVDYGDSTAITYPITGLPFSTTHEFTKTGNLKVRVTGMGNCVGEATTTVNVTQVKPQPPPPPPPPTPVAPPPPAGRPTPPVATPAPDRRAEAAPPMRFVEMDRNRDSVITRAEWTGSNESFRVHDWNGDGILSGDETRAGVAPPRRGRFSSDWTEREFQQLDRNRDGRLSRNEWQGDADDFVRLDRRGDGQLTLDEFVLSNIDDDRGDAFENLDLNRDGRIDRREWHASDETFRWLDRNHDGVLSGWELTGESDTPDRRGGFGQGAAGGRGRGSAGSQGRYGDPRGSEPLIVNAVQAWTDSRVDVRAGDSVSISASGTVQLSDNARDTADPQGARSGRMAGNSPVPRAPAGALIGRIGDGPAFLIGNSTDPIRVNRAGRLYLGINDDFVADNRGEFRVTISVNGRER